MKRPFRALATVLATGAFACGSLEANTDSAPALATVQGSIVNPDSLSVPGSIRIAVVWRSNPPDQFSVAQDLPVQPSLLSFTIAFDGPPPEPAMNEAASAAPPGSGPDGGCGCASGEQYAVGTVVAYVDENRNGKLDLVGDDAGAYVDRIIATNATKSIVYIQGPLPTVGHGPLPPQRFGLGQAPQEGYNLLDLAPPCFPPGVVPGPTAPTIPIPASPPQSSTPTPPPFAPPGWGSSAACPSSVVDAGAPSLPVGTICPTSEWRPISTPFVLTMASAPKVDSLMCANSGGGGVVASGSGTLASDAGVQPASYPAPCDPNLACSPDGSQYIYGTCTTVQRGLCQPAVTTCTSVAYTKPSPAPAAWPCP